MFVVSDLLKVQYSHSEVIQFDWISLFINCDSFSELIKNHFRITTHHFQEVSSPNQTGHNISIVNLPFWLPTFESCAMFSSIISWPHCQRRSSDQKVVEKTDHKSIQNWSFVNSESICNNFCLGMITRRNFCHKMLVYQWSWRYWINIALVASSKKYLGRTQLICCFSDPPVCSWNAKLKMIFKK